MGVVSGWDCLTHIVTYEIHEISNQRSRNCYLKCKEPWVGSSPLVLENQFFQLSLILWSQQIWSGIVDDLFGHFHFCLIKERRQNQHQKHEEWKDVVVISFEMMHRLQNFTILNSLSYKYKNGNHPKDQKKEKKKKLHKQLNDWWRVEMRKYHRNCFKRQTLGEKLPASY